MFQTAFGASCMNRAWVFEWHKRFKEGREPVRNDERCGRSKEVNRPELIGQIKNFMDKDQLQQDFFQYTLLKPDCHSWWILKMQSGREDTLEERYTIKFCFKLGKMPETFGMLQTAFRPSCMNRASVFEWQKRFKEGRESVRHEERCRSKKVNTPELIGQRLRVRVRVTMLRF